jgi:hypothetical protein
MEASAVIAVAVATDDFGGKEREAFGMLKSLLPVRSSRSSKSKPRFDGRILLSHGECKFSFSYSQELAWWQDRVVLTPSPGTY